MLAKNSQNENDNDENLQEKLREIKGQEGIIGYILRGQKSAAIDLKDPTKIIEYAVFSSAVFDISQQHDRYSAGGRGRHNSCRERKNQTAVHERQRPTPKHIHGKEC